MPDDFVLTGGEDLYRLGRRMKAAGAGALLKEMSKASNKALDPLIPKTRAVAQRRLPQRNGLAQRVAKAPQRKTTRVGATSATVRLTVAGKRSGAYGADVGTVRHPVFGRRSNFVDQKVIPGWFSDTVENEAPQVREDIAAVLEDYAERFARQRD